MWVSTLKVWLDLLATQFSSIAHALWRLYGSLSLYLWWAIGTECVWRFTKCGGNSRVLVLEVGLVPINQHEFWHPVHTYVMWRLIWAIILVTTMKACLKLGVLGTDAETLLMPKALVQKFISSYMNHWNAFFTTCSHCVWLFLHFYQFRMFLPFPPVSTDSPVLLALKNYEEMCVIAMLKSLFFSLPTQQGCYPNHYIKLAS